MDNSTIENRAKARLDKLGLTAEQLYVCRQMGMEPEAFARELEEQAMEDEIERRVGDEHLNRLITEHS